MSDRYLPPSVRNGLREDVAIQPKDYAHHAMRRAIANEFFNAIVPYYALYSSNHYLNPYRGDFFKCLIGEGLGISTLDMPFGKELLEQLRKRFEESTFTDFYDFVELVAIACKRYRPREPADIEPVDVAALWVCICNKWFEQHKSCWRFVNRKLYPTTSQEEIDELNKALKAVAISPRLQACMDHYHAALEKFRDSDYPNAGSEAIEALESLAQVALDKPGATLGSVSERFASDVGLHKSHGTIISKLYGWASDAGFRHALKEGQDPPDEPEARFMIVACSAYLNLCIEALNKKGKL